MIRMFECSLSSVFKYSIYLLCLRVKLALQPKSVHIVLTFCHFKNLGFAVKILKTTCIFMTFTHKQVTAQEIQKLKGLATFCKSMF